MSDKDSSTEIMKENKGFHAEEDHGDVKDCENTSTEKENGSEDIR